MNRTDPRAWSLGARSRRGAWAALAAAIAFGNAGNVILDGVAKTRGLSPAILLDPWLIVAIACLGMGFLGYVKALARLPLTVAYPVLVGVSIIAVTATGVLRGGAIPSGLQAAGIALVFLGIALVSKAAPPSAPAVSSAPSRTPETASQFVANRS